MMLKSVSSPNADVQLTQLVIVFSVFSVNCVLSILYHVFYMTC